MEEISTQFFKAEHLSATRMLSYALTLGEIDTWLSTIDVFKKRLTLCERSSLVFVSLKSLSPTDASCAIDAARRRSGVPITPLIFPMEDASHWADWAPQDYVEACVAAGYNRLPLHRQEAFQDYMSGKSVA